MAIVLRNKPYMEMNIPQPLAALLRDALKIDPLSISGDRKLIEIPGWDSIRFMQMLMSVERKYSVRFEAPELLNLKTWSELLVLIRSKTALS